jgi:hypothetical protein
VFEALLDKALTLCGGTFGIIRTYDGTSFHSGAMRGVPPRTAASSWAREDPQTVVGSLVGRRAFAVPSSILLHVLSMDSCADLALKARACSARLDVGVTRTHRFTGHG